MGVPLKQPMDPSQAPPSSMGVAGVKGRRCWGVRTGGALGLAESNPSTLGVTRGQLGCVRMRWQTKGQGQSSLRSSRR